MRFADGFQLKETNNMSTTTGFPSKRAGVKGLQPEHGGVIGIPDPPPQRQRVQLEFTQEAFDRMLQIKEMANATTNAEVVRNALRVYEWFLRQKAENNRLQLVKDNQVREVELML
jgi:hypothetical protein